MRLAALSLLLALCLCQPGDGQRVAAGASIANYTALGYRAPTIGAWTEAHWGRIRALGEWRDSRKAWLDDGYTLAARATVDGPGWSGIAPLGAFGVVSHRNSQWTKAGAWWGAGARWRGVYSWYSPSDSSPNRVRTWLTGYEVRGSGRWQPVAAVEYTRDWFCCTGAAGGWGLAVRVGMTLR